MEKPLLLFKYGGNAMTDNQLKEQVIKNIGRLHEQGYYVVIVHGAGPFIKEVLDIAGIKSEFIDGQRVTSKEALEYVEMALKGKVNGHLVSIANRFGYKAVGLSGKDGQMVKGVKRNHKIKKNGSYVTVDMGEVADVTSVDFSLVELLLKNGFIPIITCLATDDEGNTYNVNADMFAGHIAGAMKADQFIILTDVDGLYRDFNDKSSLIHSLTIDEIAYLKGEEVIKGGMIPKIECCEIAISSGARSARIINGTKPEQILMAVEEKPVGTIINNKVKA